ncbi:LAQU0S06e02344g1_1 [Lachancea quebecensis]|uniref:25S rRNA adenine-N(1) methyltransferase n=1 Tax=Lachancea quebecensis TaxID=1654605 RepID=A0A0P1KS68_9SACH|nr:LAQU0S06e02344g1_1 [Lachancea quebecensis]
MLSRKRKTVTGKLIVERPPAIKPAKARRIIRRFHLLINKRRIICNKINIKLLEADESANSRRISEKLRLDGAQSFYDEGWNTQNPSPEYEAQMLRVQRLDDHNQLLRILGYIMSEIHQRGGLKNYQLASSMGQDRNRGGDSSKILINWFKTIRTSGRQYRALEIGSLSAENAISTSGIFDPVTRIDLNSNDPAKILRQDFMKRPLPSSEAEKFDLISCSLVLNFVPTPQLRGAMLLRFQHFLRLDVEKTYVFLVLPLPCVSNSRYMSTELLCEIMECLGYKQSHTHESSKIIYMLFQRSIGSKAQKKHVAGGFSKKVLIRDKANMNNFSIAL